MGNRFLKRVAQGGVPLEAKIMRRARSSPRKERFAAVRRALRLVSTSSPRGRRGFGGVCGVAMVRNEADVLDASLRHLLHQGVECLVIADNESNDATQEIIEDYAREVPTALFELSLVEHFQAEVVTILSQYASSKGSRWVVPFDGDEMWFARDRLLADELMGSKVPVRSAEIYNAFQTDADRLFWNQPLRLDLGRQKLKKVAFRTTRYVYVQQGNHGLERRGTLEDGLMVLHHPWRSFDQMKRKVRAGRMAYERSNLSRNMGGHWRHLGALADEDLYDVWNRIVGGMKIPGIAWSPIGPFLEISEIDSRRSWSANRREWSSS